MTGGSPAYADVRAQWRSVVPWHTVPADAGGVSLSQRIALPSGGSHSPMIAPMRTVDVFIGVIDPTSALPAVDVYGIWRPTGGPEARTLLARPIGGWWASVPLPPFPAWVEAEITGLPVATAVRWTLAGIARPEWQAGQELGPGGAPELLSPTPGRIP